MDECIELTIDDIAYGGDGVGHSDEGMAMFVPLTAVGDRVKVRLTVRKKRYARGQVVEILSPGQGRTEPRCPHFGTCGGCQYQHLTVEEELRLKAHQLAESLRRIGHLHDLPEVSPIVSGEAYGYRNKVVLHPVPPADGKPGRYGYYTLDSQAVVPIDTCPIADPVLDAAIGDLDPDRWRPSSLTMRVAENGRIHRFHNRPRPGTPWLRETWNNRKLHVPVDSFAQVNAEVTRQLVAWLQELVKGSAPGAVVDLYCGSGLFALLLAESSGRVIGLERDRDSIHAARFTARKWGLDNAEFHSGSVEKRLPSIAAEVPSKGTLAIIDPPRGGCDQAVMDILGAWRPERLVYISCNVTSQARDLEGLLAAAPYQMRRIALFDMFPRTAHFESVVLLECEG